MTYATNEITFTFNAAKDPVFAAALRAHEEISPIARGRMLAERCFGQIRSGIDLEKMTWLSGREWNDLGAYVESLAAQAERLRPLARCVHNEVPESCAHCRRQPSLRRQP